MRKLGQIDNYDSSRTQPESPATLSQLLPPRHSASEINNLRQSQTMISEVSQLNRESSKKVAPSHQMSTMQKGGNDEYKRFKSQFLWKNKFQKPISPAENNFESRPVSERSSGLQITICFKEKSSEVRQNRDNRQSSDENLRKVGKQAEENILQKFEAEIKLPVQHSVGKPKGKERVAPDKVAGIKNQPINLDTHDSTDSGHGSQFIVMRRRANTNDFRFEVYRQDQSNEPEQSKHTLLNRFDLDLLEGESFKGKRIADGHQCVSFNSRLFIIQTLFILETEAGGHQVFLCCFKYPQLQSVQSQAHSENGRASIPAASRAPVFTLHQTLPGKPRLTFDAKVQRLQYAEAGYESSCGDYYYIQVYCVIGTRTLGVLTVLKRRNSEWLESAHLPDDSEQSQEDSLELDSNIQAIDKSLSITCDSSGQVLGSFFVVLESDRRVELKLKIQIFHLSFRKK